MRAAIVLAVLATMGTARAETFAQYEARSPQIRDAMRAKNLEPLLLTGTPCVKLDDRQAGPAIDPNAEAGESNDGTILLALATLDLDAKGARRLGVKKGFGTRVIGFDEMTGAIWARDLDVFSNCNGNPPSFSWSDDHGRVQISAPTGRGVRVAIVDLETHALLTSAFVGTYETSFDVQHIAWIPWYSGYPFADGQVSDAEVWIDDRKIWRGTQATTPTWTNSYTATFCGDDVKYRVTVLKRARLARAGRCE